MEKGSLSWVGARQDADHPLAPHCNLISQPWVLDCAPEILGIEIQSIECSGAFNPQNEIILNEVCVGNLLITVLMYVVCLSRPVMWVSRASE